MFKRVVHYYKKYKLIFALDMLAAFLIAAIGIGYPIITRLMLSRWIPNNEFRYVIIGGIVYYLIMIVVLWLRVDSNDLKLATAIIVMLALAIPNLKKGE